MINFLRSKTNESSKRLIAFLFAITLICIPIFCKSDKILEMLIYAYSILIVLLLGLATVETIAAIFKNKNM